MAQRQQTSRQAARSAARMQAGSIDLLQPRIVRRGWRLRPEAHFRYDLAMSGKVDRAAWAGVVQRLLDEECAGNKSAFARRVVVDERAINPRTVYAWLGGTMAVSEASVRAVAEGFGLNPLELLVEVGVYTPDQLPRTTPEQFDAERRLVLDSNLANDVKARILQELDRMEAEDEAAIEQLREKDRRRRRERVAVLLQQQRSA
jgi:hypothetical protein